MTVFGRGESRAPLGPPRYGRDVAGPNATAHLRLGFRKRLLDVGLHGEVGALLFSSGQLFAALDAGVTGHASDRTQVSARLFGGIHRLLDVGTSLLSYGGSAPVNLPAAGAEVEFRSRDFSDPAYRPWIGVSLFALFDLKRRTMDWDRGGGLFSQPREPALNAGGYAVGFRFRIGFDLT